MKIITKAFYSSAILAAISLLPVTTAQAVNVTTTFGVTATINASCTVSATSMNFGTYVPATASTATNTITVNCSSGAPYTVALDKGTTAGATIAQRLMNNSTTAGHTLKYNIFTDNTYATIWGDNTGTSVTVPGVGTGAAQQLTPNGQIPASQNAFSGSYTDTITATVSY